MKTVKKLIATSLISAAILVPASAFSADDVAVKITPEIASVEVTHNGKKTLIMRNQDEKNTINAAFAKTSRKCPPFCIQPATLAPGVETIGEIEVLDYLAKMNAGDSSILVIDSRTPDWVK
ncbi:MAG: rhodanese-like domain-containing protein, partial [Gammaproteobacteria bacterium]